MDPFRRSSSFDRYTSAGCSRLAAEFDPTRPASEDDPFPELRRTGGADATMELDRQKKGATSVPPVKQDPWFAPRRDKLRESLSPEEMQVLEEVFPDGELDRILDPGAIMSDCSEYKNRLMTDLLVYRAHQVIGVKGAGRTKLQP